MIIQLPEWEKWRISGESLDWQVQELTKDKSKPNGEYWRGVNFFSTLDAALGYAYERSLREGNTRIELIREVHIACEKTKSGLLREARKALG